MPIRPELKPLYPADWTDLSQKVRFGAGRNRCARCGRGPHLAYVPTLPERPGLARPGRPASSRWFDGRTWRDDRNRPAVWPDLTEYARIQLKKVVLTAAHLDGDPSNNTAQNLHCLCGKCHLLHDAAQHRWQRWLTYRARYAAGDLLLGRYDGLRVKVYSPLAVVTEVEDEPSNVTRKAASQGAE